MALNSRKRVADDGSSYPVRSKTPRLAGLDVLSLPPEPLSGAQHIIREITPDASSLLRGRHTLTRRPLESKLRWVPNNQFTSHGSSAPLPAHQQHQAYGAAPTFKPSSTTTPAVHKPVVLHQQHPGSKLCENFHWVPYPLGLMPYDSWHRLHHTVSSSPFRCPVCGQERIATAHMRKVFLVAERLSRDDKIVTMRDKNLNEELNWAVNFDLGILDPFVEDPEQLPGGRNSRDNRFYPYQNEHEMKLAFKLIFMTENINPVTWSLWIGAQLDLQNMLDCDEDTTPSPQAAQPIPTDMKQKALPLQRHVRKTRPEPIDTIDLTNSPEPPSKLARRKSYGLPSPPSPLPSKVHRVTALVINDAQYKTPSSSTTRPIPTAEHSRVPLPPKRIESYKTLQDFYTLLDKIEHTSYVGALFLEAYAEKLRDDMCRSCWLKHNVNLDLF